MNIFFPPHQEYVLLLMLVCGAVMGIVFDIFEIKRRLTVSCKIVICIDDVLFTFISAVVFIITVFVFNNGILRWYEFICCLLGFLVYKLTLSKIVLLIFGFVADILKGAFVYIIKRLLFLLNKIFNVFNFFFCLAFKLLKPTLLKTYSMFSLLRLKKSII